MNLEAVTSSGSTRPRLGPPLAVLIGAAAAAILLLDLRQWTWNAAATRIRESQGVHVEGFLQVRLGMLEDWSGKLKARFAQAVAGPLEEQSAAVSERMAKVVERLSARDYLVMSPSGAAVAGKPGVWVPEARDLQRMSQGEWRITRPSRHPELPYPFMVAGGPIRDKEGRIAAIALVLFDVDKDFARIFASPASERSPEIFAFDESGILLTELRDGERLKALGLVDESRSAFTLKLRDPGVDLGRGHVPNLSSERWPLTRMAARAISDVPTGKDIRGYRDVRGNEVIGAWAWLPDRGMGIAVELDLEEVLQPLAPLRTGFKILYGVLAAATGVLLLISFRYGIFKRQGAGTAFGTYTLEQRIGMGGMGEVYLARHALLKRPAAIKLLGQVGRDSQAAARFEREARLASRLTHPNTIQIFDYGRTPEGRLYFAMEYLEGLDLAQLVSLMGPLPPARAVYLLRQVCGSLEEAHEAGLIHRDIKPANIMLCRRGGEADVVKVLDFGIARSFTDDATAVTEAMHVPGTPVYIAPERIRSAQPADARSDLYSLGAVAFYMLTGRSVFEGAGAAEILYQVMAADRPSPSRFRGETLPAALEKLVLDCLAVEPGKRPSSARAMEEMLESMEIPGRWGAEEAEAWWAANEDRIAAFAAGRG